VTNLQARLLASALGLIAGAIVAHHASSEIQRVGFGIMIVAAVVFCVVYVRAHKPLNARGGAKPGLSGQLDRP
jgi:hypothetical protein